MELNEIDERKTNQMMKLIEEHEMSMHEMRNYYNDITQNNLTLIERLKEQMEELRNKLEHNERQLNKVSLNQNRPSVQLELIECKKHCQVTNTNRKLSRPLSESQIELVDLRKKLEHFTKERSALQRVRAQYAATAKELNATKWQMEALRMRCDGLTEERDRLRKKFEETVLEVEQKNGLKSLQLERRLNELQEEFERLRSMFGKPCVDLAEAIQSAFKEKDEHIEALECEREKAINNYNELLKAYEISSAKRSVVKAKRVTCAIAPISISK